MILCRLAPAAVLLFSSLAIFACAPASQTANAPPSAAVSAPAMAAVAPPVSAPAMASVAPSGSAAPSGSGGSGALLISSSDDLIGKQAPDFHGVAQDGSAVHLAGLRGKSVVLYFYPKDETPGCTKEACSFRDSWQAIAKTGAVLVGISGDDRESHKAFAQHYGLPFVLVTDGDGTIGRSYGVPFSGHHQRQTFVIGPDGNVRKVYRKVDVSLHAAQILDDLSHPG